MMAARAILCAAALALAGAGGASAQVHTMATAGLWNAYGGRVDDRSVCGISTTGAEGRQIAIEQPAGETGLEVVLDKPTWTIPDRAEVDAALQIDGGGAIPLRGSGSGSRVRMRMDFQQSVMFMRALRRGLQVRVYFPNGNETTWTGGLRGSSAAIDAFNACRSTLIAGPSPGQPTQPYRDPQAQPTQPFGGPARPPQL